MECAISMLATWSSTFRIPSMCAMSWACRQIFQAPFQAFVLCFPNTLAFGSQFFLKRCPALSLCWGPAFRMSSFVSQTPSLAVHLSPKSGWWCPTLQLCLHLSPNLAGGVRISGCLSSLVSLRLSGSPAVCLLLYSLHFSSSLARGVRLSGFVCLLSFVSQPVLCWPAFRIYLNLFVSPFSILFAPQNGLLFGF